MLCVWRNVVTGSHNQRSQKRPSVYHISFSNCEVVKLVHTSKYHSCKGKDNRSITYDLNTKAAASNLLHACTLCMWNCIVKHLYIDQIFMLYCKLLMQIISDISWHFQRNCLIYHIILCLPFLKTMRCFITLMFNYEMFPTDCWSLVQYIKLHAGSVLWNIGRTLYEAMKECVILKFYMYNMWFSFLKILLTAFFN